jgi:hypothetical protein
MLVVYHHFDPNSIIRAFADVNASPPFGWWAAARRGRRPRTVTYGRIGHLPVSLHLLVR